MDLCDLQKTQITNSNLDAFLFFLPTYTGKQLVLNINIVSTL